MILVLKKPQGQSYLSAAVRYVLDKKKSYLSLLRRKENPCFAAKQLGHQIVPIAILHKITILNVISRDKKETKLVAKL